MQQSTRVEYKPCPDSPQQVAGKVDRLRGLSGAVRLARTVASQHIHVIQVEDRLRLPFNGELPYLVRTLLRRGERNIVLDLARVSKIDAAGIGDLVCAYNLAMACNGRLRIDNTNPWVRQMIERVGLYARLNTELIDGEDRYRADC